MPSISYNEDNCVTARLAAYITNMKIKITQVLAMVSTTQFVVFQLMNDSTISVIINAPETQPFLHCRKHKACTLKNPVPTTKFIKKKSLTTLTGRILILSFSHLLHRFVNQVTRNFARNTHRY